MEIVVLRLHHRITRDKRMSSHLALVARAFGASKIVYSGEYDNRIEQTVAQIVESWGEISMLSIHKMKDSILKNGKEKEELLFT